MTAGDWLMPFASRRMRGLLGEEANQKKENNLTDNELQILKLMAKGRLFQEISQNTSKTRESVTAHFTNICRKFNINHRDVKAQQ
ncbi:helix-turn-helix transcriptional regulator [Candidatus Omnitrophota bacterium]